MNRENIRFVKQKILELSTTIDEKICQQFGFYPRDVSLEKIINYLHAPKDSSSLAVTRMLFGIAMLFDIAGERGGSTMMQRWGNPTTCHFPLLPFIRAIPMPYMALVYAILWLGAIGITLGYKYRVSAAAFTLCYWYLFLVEKSFWNNHSYLFGLVATLLSFTDAHCYWSLDAASPSIKKEVVPYWNYFILKYQFFILYFMAGLKKGSAEWLTGYSVLNLSDHWVFSPFRLFLTGPQTDYLVVHWFVFLFDLTVAVWMMWARTRHVAMFFCALFHLMNSRLFSIGMFPWVCLATMPLFYPFDWPKYTTNLLKTLYLDIKKQVCKLLQLTRQIKANLNVNNEEYVKRLLKDKDQVVDENLSDGQKKDETMIEEEIWTDGDSFENIGTGNDVTSSESIDEDSEVVKNYDENENGLQKPCNKNDKRFKKCTFALILFLVVTQAFLPFSHFITQGYNNWTNGLYGYSWDMMVHTWDTNSVVIKIIDNEKDDAEFYIDPNMYALNDRWTRHGDMVYQYAHCVKDNILTLAEQYGESSRIVLSKNLSLYVDVWCSMNGRFTQRMFDSKQDLLKVSWSPFEPVSYLMPLLDEASSWRKVLHQLREEVHSWHNASDVIFMADFPGYHQEKYIPTDLSNVSLTVLEGKVLFEPEVSENVAGQTHQLTVGKHINVKTGQFHRVFGIGETPIYYMYTFVNTSDVQNTTKMTVSKLPIAREFTRHLENMIIFVNIVISSILQILGQFTQCPNI